MTPNTVIVILLLAIMVALFAGLFFMVKGPGKKNDTSLVRALSWRVGLQALLILFLVVAFFMGWIKPHGVVP